MVRLPHQNIQGLLNKQELIEVCPDDKTAFVTESENTVLLTKNKISYSQNESNKVNKAYELLCIFHQNVCGLTSKKDQLEMYLDMLDTPPQFVCVTEHFLDNNSAAVVNFTKYELSTCHVRSRKKRGGALILVEKERKVKNIANCKQFSKDEHLELCGGHKRFYFLLLS